MVSTDCFCLGHEAIATFEICEYDKTKSISFQLKTGVHSYLRGIERCIFMVYVVIDFVIILAQQR